MSVTNHSSQVCVSLLLMINEYNLSVILKAIGVAARLCKSKNLKKVLSKRIKLKIKEFVFSPWILNLFCFGLQVP